MATVSWEKGGITQILLVSVNNKAVIESNCVVGSNLIVVTAYQSRADWFFYAGPSGSVLSINQCDMLRTPNVFGLSTHTAYTANLISTT